MSFLGIKVPKETARLLSTIDVPGKKVDSNSLHITLLCFEEDMSINKISKAMQAAYEITSEQKPFTVKLNGLNHFPKGENGFPVICPISSKEILSFREKLAKKFDKEKISFRKNFDFNPHITLSYSDDKPSKEKFDKIEFAINDIVLWGGDDGEDKLFITFPLNLDIKKKSSFMIEATSITSNEFYKRAIK